MPRCAFYGLFIVSGFAGLIYESIWAQYLKLFLGHAAYAQSLVLAVFMGGMAVGAAAAGRFSERLVNPLLVYARVEAMIGLLALALDRKSTRLNSSHITISYAVFCLKKK